MKQYTLYRGLATLCTALAFCSCGEDPEVPHYESRTLESPTSIGISISSRIEGMVTNIGDDLFHWEIAYGDDGSLMHSEDKLICYNLNTRNENVVWEEAEDYPTRITANHLEYKGYTMEFDYSLLNYNDEELLSKWFEVCVMMREASYTTNNGSNKIYFYSQFFDTETAQLITLDINEKKVSLYSLNHFSDISEIFYLNNKIYARGLVRGLVRGNAITGYGQAYYYLHNKDKWELVGYLPNHDSYTSYNIYNNHIYFYNDEEYKSQPQIEVYDENLELQSTIKCDIPRQYWRDYWIHFTTNTFISKGNLYTYNGYDDYLIEINLQNGKGKLLKCTTYLLFETYFIANDNIYYTKDGSCYTLNLQ